MYFFLCLQRKSEGRWALNDSLDNPLTDKFIKLAG